MAEADGQVAMPERQSLLARATEYRAIKISSRAARALRRGDLAAVEGLAQRSCETPRRHNETAASLTFWSRTYYLPAVEQVLSPAR